MLNPFSADASQNMHPCSFLSLSKATFLGRKHERMPMANRGVRRRHSQSSRGRGTAALLCQAQCHMQFFSVHRDRVVLIVVVQRGSRRLWNNIDGLCCFFDTVSRNIDSWNRHRRPAVRIYSSSGKITRRQNNLLQSTSLSLRGVHVEHRLCVHPSGERFARASSAAPTEADSCIDCRSGLWDMPSRPVQALCMSVL